MFLSFSLKHFLKLILVYGLEIISTNRNHSIVEDKVKGSTVADKLHAITAIISQKSLKNLLYLEKVVV